MKKLKKIVIDRQFADYYAANSDTNNKKHTFILGGKNDKVERLALEIAESGTALSYQPRRWAKEIIKELTQTKKKIVLLRRARLDYMRDVFAYSDGEIDCVAEGVTAHRSRVIMAAYNDYLDGKINEDVWNNYCTNGYNTRRGLYVNYTHKINRIKRIAESHTECDAEGQAGHDYRVALRNSGV